MPVHGSFSFAQDKKNSVAHCCAELRVKAWQFCSTRQC
jgi:hypothetical protein